MIKVFRSDVRCPYCLEEITNRDVKYYCSRCGNEVERSKYEIFAMRAPKCTDTNCHGAVANICKCGICGHVLPPDIFQYKKNLRFSIIGITGCGKSMFLTTMIHELRNIKEFPLVISSMDSETENLFKENETTTYVMGQMLAPNPKGLPPQPQQWRLRDKSKMTERTIPSYSLTIFDGAGEDCQHIDPVISRYITESKELIILFDPLALSSFSKTLPDEVIMRSTVSDQVLGASGAMVNEVANYIRSCGVRADRLIDKDVAVVFTKIDEVADTFDFATVLTPSPHAENKAFVETDSNAVDEEIREWLHKNGEADFINAITSNFNPRRVRYFGISSVGHVPKDDGSPGTITPLRVLDPIFWMLAKEKILPTISADSIS